MSNWLYRTGVDLWPGDVNLGTARICVVIKAIGMLGSENRSRPRTKKPEEHLIGLSQGDWEEVVREVLRGKPRTYSVIEAGKRVSFKKGKWVTCMLLRGQIQ